MGKFDLSLDERLIDFIQRQHNGRDHRALEQYMAEWNRKSIDGLDGLGTLTADAC
jgi:hypothetical protein